MGVEPPLRPQRLAAWLLGAALCLLAGAALGANPVVFSAIGDVPYSDAELVDLQTHIDNLSLYSPSAFLIHLGDIKSGSETCQESRYQAVADILKTSAIPVFIVPGDNEWVNCTNPDQGWAWWTQYLLGLEENFCGIWPVNAQSTRPENFSFVRDGVLFIGLNYVAGTPSAVVQADADWVNAQFTAYGATARAAVLMAQKEPGGALFDAVKAKGHAFAKPVLYIHGDGHSWLVDPAFFGEPNILRVQVDRGTLSHPPVEVTVASDGTFLFDRDPWPAGTSQITRAACSGPSLSIDDVFATEGGNAVFTVSLAGATGGTVSVSYATQGGSATSGQDFSSRSGTLTFSGTTTQQQISVPITQDTTPEDAETFTVNLSNASGAAIAKPQGSAVIIDDDSSSTSGAPVRREVASGVSVSSSSVATSGPLSAVAGDLYLAAVAFKPNVAVASVTGLGLAWTPVRAQCAGRAQTGVALFRAQGTPTGSGPVTATLGSVPSAAVIEVAHYSGASTSGALGSVASANTNGVSGACANGVDGATYAFPLTTGAANSLVFVAAAMRSKDHLPGSGFTEIVETYASSGGSAAGESLAERVVASATSLSVNGGFDSTVDWAVVAAEVRASGGSGGGGTTPVTLTVTTTGSGSVALSPAGGSYAPGTSVTLTATPAAGWAFGGWSGGLSGSANPATLTVNANTTVNATFLPLYTVSVTPTTGGSATLSPSGGTYPSGTLLTVTAVPQAGYVFTGWSGALSGTRNPESLLVDSNKTLAASFAPAYTVSVSTTGNGSVSLSPSGGSYPSGTLVTLTAVPGSGASFLGWGGALSGTQNPTTLLVDSNKSVTAAFSASFTLSISTKGKGSVTMNPPGGSYSSGTQVTLTAVPGSGFAFTGWSGDVSGTANPVTVLMDRNKSATASFKKR